MPVNGACGTREKGHRPEHRREHQSDPDQGAGDLVHGLAGRLPRRKPLFAHDPLDVFHHHDGIVDQEADGQHHGEHGQHVDREPEEPQYREGPKEYHGHGDRRDQGGPDIPQEKVHDQENQQDRLDEGLDHFLDGYAGKRGGVVGVDHLHTRGKVFAHLFELRLDGIGRVQGIGAGDLPNSHRG